MSILTKESDLLEFINQKKQDHIDVTPRRIVSMYSKMMNSAIVKPLEKLGIGSYSVSCLETVGHLFWILFYYSKNLKLTMFLCDRAILLFNEYIVMTKTTMFGNNSLDSINLSGVKLFVYKKTIGPIHFENSGGDTGVDTPEQYACKLVKEIYTAISIAYCKGDYREPSLPHHLNQVWSLLSETIYEFLKEKRNRAFLSLLEYMEVAHTSIYVPVNTLYCMSLLLQHHGDIPLPIHSIEECCAKKYKTKLLIRDTNDKLLLMLETRVGITPIHHENDVGTAHTDQNYAAEI